MVWRGCPGERLRGERLKTRIHEVLEVASASDRISRVFDLFIVSLIVANVLALVLGTVPGIDRSVRVPFRWFEIVSVAIFSIEYALRIWSFAPGDSKRRRGAMRLRFATRGMMIVDLLAVLPFYVALAVPAAAVLDLRFLRILRLMRIFRLFKLGRYLKAVRLLGRVARAKKEELGVAVVAVLMLLLVASSLMYFAENQVQPEAFSSIPASMWWGVTALTTVGYGDVVPITGVGKTLGALVSILGIGLFALPAGILAAGFQNELQAGRQEAVVCPHCGGLVGREEGERA